MRAPTPSRTSGPASTSMPRQGGTDDEDEFLGGRLEAVGGVRRDALRQRSTPQGAKGRRHRWCCKSQCAGQHQKQPAGATRGPRQASPPSRRRAERGRGCPAHHTSHHRSRNSGAGGDDFFATAMPACAYEPVDSRRQEECEGRDVEPRGRSAHAMSAPTWGAAGAARRPHAAPGAHPAVALPQGTGGGATPGSRTCPG